MWDSDGERPPPPAAPEEESDVDGGAVAAGAADAPAGAGTSAAGEPAAAAGWQLPQGLRLEPFGSSCAFLGLPDARLCNISKDLPDAGRSWLYEASLSTSCARHEAAVNAVHPVCFLLPASCFMLPAARTESHTAGIDLQRQCTSRMPSFDCADSELRAVNVRIPLGASPISHDARIRTAGAAAAPDASSHAQMLRLERLSVTAPAAADAGGEGDAPAARPPQPLLSARTQQVQMQMHSFGSRICDPCHLGSLFEAMLRKFGIALLTRQQAAGRECNKDDT